MKASIEKTPTLVRSGSLEGKKVIILGGSSGLGLATAHAAATEGAHVIIVSGNHDRIDQALSQLPGKQEGHAIDLSKEDNIRNFFEQNGSCYYHVFIAV